jgi:hypothetical protein
VDSQDELLKLAERHVLEGEARVTRMAAVVSRRAAMGLDTAEAEAYLGQLLVLLKDMHERLIQQQESYRSRRLGLQER